jgi:acetyl esterase/lipase
MLAASCGTENQAALRQEQAMGEEQPPGAAPEPAIELAENERGQVVSSQEWAEIDPALAQRSSSAYRVRYRSTFGPDGSGTVVSGAVFVPLGAPPEGGWPVVSVAHGTTGVDPECGPSLHPDLLGASALVAPLLDRGYVVAVPDYQGLGEVEPGTEHPYLEPKTAAYNVIDAVRAARGVVDGASNRWASLGVSQGGHAAWAAAEFADEYDGELEFVGSASLVPAADLSPAVRADPPWRLNPLQLGFIPFVLEGMKAVDPGIDFADYARGGLLAGFEALTSCTAGPGAKVGAILQSAPEDLGPFTDEATAEIREWLEQAALPQRGADGPLFVVYGGRDAIINQEWTAQAVQRACDLGDVVYAELRPEADHFSLGATDEAAQWLADRFAGVEAPDTCG